MGHHDVDEPTFLPFATHTPPSKTLFSLEIIIPVSQCTQYEVCYALPFNLDTMMVRAYSTPCRRRASMVCLLSAMMRLIPHTPLCCFALHDPLFFFFFGDVGWNITATRAAVHSCPCAACVLLRAGGGHAAAFRYRTPCMFFHFSSFASI